MLKFIPRTLAETMVDLGYDSQGSLTSTVISMDDANQWIELILDTAHLSSKIPKSKWRVNPMVGQLRTVWSTCCKETPWVPPGQSFRQDPPDNRDQDLWTNAGAFDAHKVPEDPGRDQEGPKGQETQDRRHQLPTNRAGTT